MRKQKKKKLNVPAGRGIERLLMDEEMEIEDCSVDPKPSTSRKARRQKDSSDENDNDQYSCQDSDSDLILSDISNSEDEFDEGSKTNEVHTCKIPNRREVKMEELSEGTFVIVDLMYNENTKKSVTKQFYAKVIEKDHPKNSVKVRFFRKTAGKKSLGNDYVFPLIDDEMEIKLKNIITSVEPTRVFRGRYTFPFEIKC